MADRVELVMKRIHVLFARCEAFEESPDRIVVNKREMFNLLEDLNTAVYEVLEQYEATSRSRERGMKEAKEKKEQLMAEARLATEDMNAAALLYTDTIVGKISDELAERKLRLRRDYEEMASIIDNQIEDLNNNKAEIKDQLSLMMESEIYLRELEALREEEQRDAKEREAELEEIENAPLQRSEKPAGEIKKPGVRVVSKTAEAEDEEDAAPRSEIVVKVHAPGDSGMSLPMTRSERKAKEAAKRQAEAKAAAEAAEEPRVDSESGEPIPGDDDSIIPEGVSPEQYIRENFDIDREFEEWEAEQSGDAADEQPQKKGFSLFRKLF